jgi:hypothetical protein
VFEAVLIFGQVTHGLAREWELAPFCDVTVGSNARVKTCAKRTLRIA